MILIPLVLGGTRGSNLRLALLLVVLRLQVELLARGEGREGAMEAVEGYGGGGEAEVAPGGAEEGGEGGKDAGGGGEG